MNLSELVTGQEAYITGIRGNNGIKKRLNELGFIAGQKVKAIKAAPLKDPVEYDIMGYKLTIRKKDAATISINDVRAERGIDYESAYNVFNPPSERKPHGNADRPARGKTIRVAMAGNPNCGKTTIFNFATKSRERVANYSGVTVAAKEARLTMDGYNIIITDLPGTYSLSAYSPEEMFVADFLQHNRPDIVINVLDAGNLERNLYLTSQLIDMGVNTVAALNMYDELESGINKLDHKALGELLGISFVPTTGSRGLGIRELFRTVIRMYEGNEPLHRQVRIPYGQDIERAVSSLTDYINKNISAGNNTISRFAALQLLEGDKGIIPSIDKEKKEELSALCTEKRRAIEKGIAHDFNTEVVNSRYGFIEGALAGTYTRGKETQLSLTQRIDKALTHKLWGLPVFFAVIWFIFFATFRLGEIPMTGIDRLFGWLSHTAGTTLPEGMLNTLITDGIIGGVGGVIVFLPNIMILFFLISVLEDSGYMARTAFLMDKVMHKAGLHGKSFIPLLMGFGCNVPAIMATRTIESKRDRLITMFITPFMSCSARLPVYVLFISAFFPRFEALMLFIMYAIGIIAALLTAILLNKTIFRRSESPFVMELPPYRMPTLKVISKHTWFKTSHFLKKMGTIILFASIIIWALGYFPRDKAIIEKYNTMIEEAETLSSPTQKTEYQLAAREQADRLESMKKSELLENSYISRLGKSIQPVFEPLGFDWKMSVSILTGIMAKEVVVSSMSILYQAEGDGDKEATLVNRLRQSREDMQVPLATYFGFLVFVLLYFPCMGALIAIKKETAKFKWTFFSALYPLVFAWLTAFLIRQAGIWIF
ncbi:MAG: ferrous iron transport protein B [Bacteroidales bacterium]